MLHFSQSIQHLSLNSYYSNFFTHSWLNLIIFQLNWIIYWHLVLHLLISLWFSKLDNYYSWIDFYGIKMLMAMFFSCLFSISSNVSQFFLYSQTLCLPLHLIDFTNNHIFVFLLTSILLDLLQQLIILIAYFFNILIEKYWLFKLWLFYK